MWELNLCIHVRVYIFLFWGHLYLYLFFENTFPFRGLVLVSANHRLGTSGVRFELGKWSMLVVLNLTFLNHYWFRQPSTDQWRARSCLPFKQNMHNQREAWCLVKRFSCKTWKDRAINLGSFNILTQNRSFGQSKPREINETYTDLIRTPMLVLQGDFFNWPPPEFAKCWPVSNWFQKNVRVPDWPPLWSENA